MKLQLTISGACEIEVDPADYQEEWDSDQADADAGYQPGSSAPTEDWLFEHLKGAFACLKGAFAWVPVETLDQYSELDTVVVTVTKAAEPQDDGGEPQEGPATA
jgi:hypothetical protein